ncbi:MAG: MFS transporter [Promethearchaeota archaeon]|jgi:MFS family permease
MTEKDNSKRTTKLILGVSVPVLIMGLVSFFTDVSSESINSILSLFIIDLAPNNPAFYLGLIAGVTTALSNILKGVSGWMSDKVNKRKPFVVAGYTISNLSKPFIGLAPSWQVVLGLKATDRVGKGLRTSSRDTLISFYAVEKGKAFGMHRSMDTLGAVVGSLLASLFLFWAWSYSQIIFFSIFPGICAIILILLVKDVDPTKLDETKLKYYGVPKVDKIDKRFIKLIVILGVIEFASLDLAFLQARSLDFISPGLIFLIPLFFLFTNIVYMVLSPITGSLSDRIGRKPVIIVGLSLLLFSCIVLAFPIQNSLFSLIVIIIIYAMYGIYLASVDPISRAYIADLAGKNKRGRAYGYYYLSVGLISLVESLLFGFIYDTFSFTWAFLYTGILLFIFIIAFAITDFSKIIKKEE